MRHTVTDQHRYSGPDCFSLCTSVAGKVTLTREDELKGVDTINNPTQCGILGLQIDIDILII